MFLNSLTIGTDTFDKQTIRPLSATYVDNNQTLSNPRSLTISHEIGKSGQVATAVILDDNAIVPIGNSNVTDKVRVLFKIQYNPLQGRTGLDTAIKAAIVQLTGFMSDSANVVKLLNKES